MHFPFPSRADLVYTPDQRVGGYMGQWRGKTIMISTYKYMKYVNLIFLRGAVDDNPAETSIVESGKNGVGDCIARCGGGAR